MVSQVTKRGCSSVFGLAMDEDRDDLDEASESSVNAVRLELDDNVDGVEEDEVLADEEACSLESSLGLGGIRSVPCGAALSSPSTISALPSISERGNSLYCAHNSSTCPRSNA